MRYERVHALFDGMAADLSAGLDEDACLRRLVARGFVAVNGDPDHLEDTLDELDALVALLESEGHGDAAGH